MCDISIVCSVYYFFFFFFKQKTAYEMRISDWSSDVCSSDLLIIIVEQPLGRRTGMWFGLTCGEPCLGQPPFHRIKAGPGHERSRAADQAGELVAGRSVGCGPADGIAFLEIGHEQPRPQTRNRSLSCPVWRAVSAGGTGVGYREGGGGGQR